MFRILKISAALAALGAVGGAIGGCLALPLALISGAVRTSTEISFSFLAAVVTLVGCGCGILVAPLLSWTVLRNVPLWRCATETALATSFALISATALGDDSEWKMLAVVVLAAALATARLKWEFRRRGAPEPEAVA